MRQVKAWDTVRIKTAKEMAAIGKKPNEWNSQTCGLLGTKQTVEKVCSDAKIKINGIWWAPDEYVLLPEIPERGEEVYVSDVSEQDALEMKERRIFITYIEGLIYPFVVVHRAYEKQYKNSEQFMTTGWRFAVKKSALQKITKDELPAFLADHGYEPEG